MKLRLMLESQLRIGGIDPEEDWEAAEGVDAAFRASHIGVDRDKQISLVAWLDDEPVGGVYSSWQPDHDDDSWTYSFDVAVHPDFRWGQGKVGLRLVDAAIRQYECDKHDYGDRTKMHLHVVNPQLARYLEDRLGFERECSYEGGAYLVRY